MNKNKEITKLESKIQKIQNLLTNWTQKIATYHSQLEKLTNQLNLIKNQTNTKTSKK